MPSYNKPPLGAILPYGGKYGGVRPDNVGDYDLVLLLDANRQPVDPGGSTGSYANGALWKNDRAKFVRYAANHPIYAETSAPASPAGSPPTPGNDATSIGQALIDRIGITAAKKLTVA